MKSFYELDELNKLGFLYIGKNVQISRNAVFYGIERIHIGENVRIDDFCIISAGSGGIKIGNYVHIAIYSSLMGDGKIILEDFSGLSSRVSVYSSNDDYTGRSMSNPTVPKEYTSVTCGTVRVCKHVLIGSGSIILPGITIEEGAVVGALSMVNNNCDAFYIYKGNPAKKIFKRFKDLLELEVDLIKSRDINNS